MIELKRRQFLHVASAYLGGLCVAPALGQEPAIVTAPAAPTEAPAIDPQVLFLSWQRDPCTTMTIQWIGAEDDGSNVPVWYSKDKAMEWQQSAPTAHPYPMSKHVIYRTELTGLEPGAEYRFRLGMASAEKRFRTMPARATNTIEFITGGDAGVGKATEHTNQIAAAQDPMFVILGGDLAYENGIAGGVFMQFMKNYSQQLIDTQGRLVPLLGCLGNHEVRGGYGRTRKDAPFFYSVFDGLFPDTGFNVLDFGDYMSIVLLDSNHTSPIGGEQASWLEQVLREREECPNVFVVYHVPAYPSFRPVDLDDAEKGTGSDARKHWVPLFERYNVDAVLEHHDHTFKRTHPLLGGLFDPDGVPYLGDGSWGKLRRPKTPEERPYLAITKEEYHLSLHRIEGKQRFHVALSEKGKVVDVCMTKKRTRALHADPSL